MDAMEQHPPHQAYDPTPSKGDVSVSCSPAASPTSKEGYANQPQEPNDSLPLGQATHRKRWEGTLSSLRWWLPEILAALCAVTAFAAIVGVARHYRGHSIQGVGLPSGLTLNGLIALLSTTARAAILIPVASALSQEVWLWLSRERRQVARHAKIRDLQVSDEASRGAWGSLLFLRHFRRSWIAHAAAVVTILSLLFGTLTQQLITIKAFPISTHGGMASHSPRNVPRSTHWADYSGRRAEGLLSPPLALKAAAYSGILSSTAAPLHADCSTGNCTWPITPSLAICGGCVDSTFKRSCNEGKVISTESFSDGGSISTTSPATCEYKMPSGITANITNFEILAEGVGFQVFQSPGYHFPRDDNNTLYLANWEAVGAPANSLAAGLRTHQNDTTVASECALWMCVQSFDTWQQNSNQMQNVRDTYSRIDTSTRAASSVGYNVSFLNLPDVMNPSVDEDFSVGDEALSALTSYFSTLFEGNITLNEGAQIPSSDPMQALWNASADLGSWIGTVAGSMTNVIRTLDPAERNPMYDGTGYQLCYDIQWGWIALPTILVIVSLVILVAIIIKTASSPVKAWKGSPLNMLFMKVDRDLRSRAMGQIDNQDGIKKVVGKTPVLLARNDDREWVLKQA